jgi:hypothetical protein
MKQESWGLLCAGAFLHVAGPLPALLCISSKGQELGEAPSCPSKVILGGFQT